MPSLLYSCVHSRYLFIGVHKMASTIQSAKRKVEASYDTYQNLTKHKRAAIEMFARGARRQEIADYFRVTYMAVRQFERNNDAEITRLRGELHDALDGLWIADKVERVVAYQEVADSVRDWTSKHGSTVKTYRYDEDGSPFEYDEKFDAAPATALSKVLRSTAEELGQLPKNETTVNVGVFVRQVAGYEGDVG